MAARHWHVELAQDFLALVFVDLHGLLGGMGWSGLRAALCRFKLTAG
jgi:hypothetical protein